MVTSSVCGGSAVGRCPYVDHSTGDCESAMEIYDVIGHQSHTTNASHYTQLIIH